MNNLPANGSRWQRQKVLLGFAALYLVLGGAWVYVSDTVILRLGLSPVEITRYQTLKGAAYVVVTALLAYCYLARTLERQHQTLTALLRSERKYRELLEHANSIILHWTRDGRIMFLNEFGQRFFGYSEAEIIGRHAVGTIVPETESTGRDLRPLIDLIAADPAAFERNTNENMRSNGERVWIAWTNKVYFDDQGRVEGFLSIGTDITERKRADEELRRLNAELEQRVIERTADLVAAKERAESADRLKSVFLASMSHEVRTPLNSIIGFTGIMLRGLPGPLNAEQSKQLGMVQGSARHLVALINDILDLSKIEAGQLEMEAKPFDVGESVERVEKLVAPLAREKKLTLTSAVSPEVGELNSDRRRYEQVLINLLNNALKFTEKGQVRVECAIHGRNLVTRVKDTGIGIAPDDLPHIFRRFYRCDRSRSLPGTGLGLTLVEAIVRAHRGQIAVASIPNTGTTFTITLPCASTAS